ncbi:C40 family peptidase [Blastococcus litoris]|uniref:C40 family peptidase n=1 Tax=Blastococcus litoris TaxID=2171622 RepID=UPI001F1464B9|nr:NlpC/P60 family protein [Blastococcus litoris]
MATTDRIRMSVSPRHFRKRTLLLAVVAVVGVDLASAPAAADPVTAEDAASLVAERGHQLEVLTEAFNEARENLEIQQAAAAAATADIANAEADLAALSDQLATVAQTAYAGDGLSALQAFMTSGSPEEFVDRVALLESVAGHHSDVVDRVSALQAAAEEARATAARAAADAQQQVDEVAAQQSELQAEIADYRAQYAALNADQQEAADAAHGGQTLAAPSPGVVVANSAAAQTAVDTAMAQLGDPYVWAAAGPDSFDCSGLTQYAFAAAGISLPHSSRLQAAMGQAVSRADLQPGDLVYFYSPVSHIGIYIGGGQMVHASTFGEPVKVGSVDMSGYAGARRIV